MQHGISSLLHTGKVPAMESVAHSSDWRLRQACKGLSKGKFWHRLSSTLGLVKAFHRLNQSGCPRAPSWSGKKNCRPDLPELCALMEHGLCTTLSRCHFQYWKLASRLCRAQWTLLLLKRAHLLFCKICICHAQPPRATQFVVWLLSNTMSTHFSMQWKIKLRRVKLPPFSMSCTVFLAIKKRR